MQDWQARQREHLFFTWSAQRGKSGMQITDAEGAFNRLHQLSVWINAAQLLAAFIVLLRLAAA